MENIRMKNVLLFSHKQAHWLFNRDQRITIFFLIGTIAKPDSVCYYINAIREFFTNISFEKLLSPDTTEIGSAECIPQAMSWKQLLQLFLCNMI